jgi:DegV family protein with EDD domain
MSDARPVQVVTDSTADLPASLRNALGIAVVPLTVTFGQESFEDGVEITPPQFLDRMRAGGDLPKTSQPASSKFAADFERALAAGRDVVCVTISSELSGTYNAARLAAEQVDDARIRVIDSRAATMQLGWIVVEAARAAQEGGALQSVVDRATAAMPRAHLFAILQTLDYVYKGGRIGKAQQVLGSALAIKPVLGVIDGVVTPIERIRTWKKALGRATELAATTGTPSDIAVLHADNLADAEATAAALRQRFPDATIVVDWAGSTITTYAGPGAIGIMTLT